MVVKDNQQKFKEYLSLRLVSPTKPRRHGHLDILITNSNDKVTLPEQELLGFLSSEQETTQVMDSNDEVTPIEPELLRFLNSKTSGQDMLLLDARENLRSGLTKTQIWNHNRQAR